MLKPARRKRSMVATSRLPLGMPILRIAVGALIGRPWWGRRWGVRFRPRRRFADGGRRGARSLRGRDLGAGLGVCAFEPEGGAGGGVKGRGGGFDGLLKRLFVHEADHQDAAGSVVLNHGHDQAAEFAEIQIHGFTEKLTPIKKPASYLGGPTDL